MSFGKKLRELREKRGLTQEALGEELGYSRQIISAWERESHHPALDKLETICKYFEVSSTYFIDEINEQDIISESEVALTETENLMKNNKKFVHRGWKIILGITFVILILSILLIGVFILLNIDFESEGYYDYQYGYGSNFEPKYIALYISIFIFLLFDIILFIISLKKLRGSNNEKK